MSLVYSMRHTLRLLAACAVTLGPSGGCGDEDNSTQGNRAGRGGASGAGGNDASSAGGVSGSTGSGGTNGVAGSGGLAASGGAGGSRGDASADAGADASADAGGGDGGRLVAPLETWTWIEIPGMTCANGSPTGIGVNLTNKSKDVLVFFEGGGACWDATTCWVLPFSLYISSGYGKRNSTQTFSAACSS